MAAELFRLTGAGPNPVNYSLAAIDEDGAATGAAVLAKSMTLIVEPTQLVTAVVVDEHGTPHRYVARDLAITGDFAMLATETATSVFHGCEIEDDDGWYVVRCSCGWGQSGLPDQETAADSFGDHREQVGFEKGRAS